MTLAITVTGQIADALRAIRGRVRRQADRLEQGDRTRDAKGGDDDRRYTRLTKRNEEQDNA